jgi:plastocyanin
MSVPSKYLCAAVFAGAASLAHAAEHQIMLVEHGFFPEVSYVSIGDTVTFVNTTEVSENVLARDFSWEVPTMASGGSQQIIIQEDMLMNFIYDEDYNNPNSSFTKHGSFSFDTAPLTIASE